MKRLIPTALILFATLEASAKVIALDTHVIVRFLVGDDPAQARIARDVMSELSEDRPGFICREVVLELLGTGPNLQDRTPPGRRRARPSDRGAGDPGRNSG